MWACARVSRMMQVQASSDHRITEDRPKHGTTDHRHIKPFQHLFKHTFPNRISSIEYFGCDSLVLFIQENISQLFCLLLWKPLKVKLIRLNKHRLIYSCRVSFPTWTVSNMQTCLSPSKTSWSLCVIICLNSWWTYCVFGGQLFLSKNLIFRCTVWCDTHQWFNYNICMCAYKYIYIYI